ncbi:ArgE/DapE family deacylase [Aerococcaceae bacterium DSM 111176]|nr:ArgE/DapE family deacylase [Aerococcaceae bacterium DSM 111176]
MISNERAVSILQDLIRIQSENDFELQVAEYIQNLLNECDIASEIIHYEGNRASLVAEISHGSSDKVLGLSGHTDVVKAGNVDLWDHDPYGAEIVDGKMYGRGTSDMKGGLAALIIAFIHAHEQQNFNGTIRFMATLGEETGEMGARQLSDLGYADDLNGILVAEPFNNRILHMHGGSYNYRISSHGVATHSSTPHKGQNAIQHLRDFMVLLQEKLDIALDVSNDKLGKPVHSITLIQGGEQINSIPEYAEYKANARTIPEFNNDDLTRLIQECVKTFNGNSTGHKIEFEILADMPVVTSNPHSELIQVIHDVSHQSDIEVIALPGTTDTAQFQRRNKEMDVAIYGPGDVNLAHQLNEFIEVDDYLEFIPTFNNIISGYLK